MTLDKIQRSCNDYAVGWLAALPSERAAAELVLKEEHNKPDDFEQPVSDPNSYTWGEILGHNVVIASLSSGQLGTVSAVSTALSMLSSFPRIRFVLMVGIGGGIPHEGDPDIRLGDVVVGQAVYQYDLGKIKTGAPWKDKSHLNKPPQLLLRALANLEAKRCRGVSQVTNFICEGISKLPKKRQKDYAHPGMEHDHLFRSDYIHPGGIDCTTCDDTKLIRRGLRDDLEPEVHVGNIASGNMVVKDTSYRDFVSSLVRANCICFEMEAAGLMNDIPCMAIRGICDYADTHKNKRWQQYAAITAAAVAKDLLSYVTYGDIAALPDALKIVQQDLRYIKDGIVNLTQGGQENKVKDWLRPCDPSTNYIQARKMYLPGTGSWFFGNHNYTRWKTKETHAIWLYGIPGCGKTILSSTVIEELRSANAIVLYFYFDFKDLNKTTFESMLRSLVFQLYHQSEKSQKHLENSMSPEEPSNQKLEQVLQTMINDSHNVYIVLDALDECKPWQELLVWLEAESTQRLNILLTSRRESDIEASLTKWTPVENRLAIKNENVDKDVRSLVQKTIETDRELARWRQNDKICALIEVTLMNKAQGMFRWAVCQLDTLRKCLDRKSLFKALDTLPEGLNNTYARILGEIPSENRSNAIRLLQFLTFSVRPLELAEAVDALAVDLGATPYFAEEYRMPVPLEVARYCGSLTMVISRETEQGIITELQLAHLSVREYLISQYLDNNIKPDFDEARANNCIVQVCLAYLFEASQRAPTQQMHLPFEDFAARYCMRHARSAEKDGEVALEWIHKLFADKSFYTYWSRIANKYNGFKEQPDPLYYASMGGLEVSVKRLLDNGASANAKGGIQGHDSALCMASRFGYVEIVKLLLDSGAAVGSYRNALAISSEQGHIEIVRLLLARDANIDIDGHALYAASVMDHHEIVKLLVNDSTTADACSEPLYAAACMSGNIEVVKLLLSRGAYNEDAIGDAAKAGHIEVVKLLLEDADPDTYDRAFESASWNGHIEIVKLLMDRGVVDRDNTALQLASGDGHIEVVKLLLEKGPGPNITRILNSAIFQGQMEVVRLLHQWMISCTTEKAIHLNQDSQGRNVLHYAAMSGSVATLDYLLANSDTSITEDRFGRNILDYASMSKSPEMVERVLKLYQTKDLNIKSTSIWSPLHWACREGSYAIVKLLIEAGIKSQSIATMSPETSWSPFDLAVYWGNNDLVSMKDDSCLQALKPQSHVGYSILVPLNGLRSNALSCPGSTMATMSESIPLRIYKYCDGCRSHIYGPYFRCRRCSDFDYCFMCKHEENEAHPEHTWDLLESLKPEEREESAVLDGDLRYSGVFNWAGH